MKRKLRIIHGSIVYLVAILLVISPILMNYEEHHGGLMFSLFFGYLSIFVNLSSNYEGGLFRKFSFRALLHFTAVSGVIILISPIAFDFYKLSGLLHYLSGGLLVISSVYTYHGHMFHKRKKRQVLNQVYLN
jgi:hypothetical protein